MSKSLKVVYAFLIIISFLLGCATPQDLFSPPKAKQSRIFKVSFEAVIPHLENILGYTTTSFSKVKEDSNVIVYEAKTGSVSGESLEIKVSKLGDHKTEVYINAKPINPLFSCSVHQAIRDILDPLITRLVDVAEDAAETKQAIEEPMVTDIKIVKAKLKSAFEKGAITADQLSKAMDELKQPNRSKILEAFSEDKIDEKKFGELY